MSALVPVIICGGSGSRLWPVSRSGHAKPFARLPGLNSSLLAQTYSRLAGLPLPPTAVLTVAAAETLFLCRESAANIPAPHLFIGEPVARNTAPAVVAAAAMVRQRFGEDAVLLVLPADHLVADPAAFWTAAAYALQAAENGRFALLGITADSPATGYGYIECGMAQPGSCFAVRQFVEKPERRRAEEFLAAGNFLWNAGIFCFTAKTLFAALPTLAPELQAPLAELSPGDAPTWLPETAAYARFPDISFDCAVMEKTDNAVVVAADAGWSDAGSWQALAQTLPADDAGNRRTGEALLLDCHNCFVAGEQRLIAAIALNDVHIIDTPDALLVARADSGERLREVFASLQKQARPEAATPATVRRPWGSYTVLAETPGYKVKRLEVLPGGRLSLQSHRHRSEHWTTVTGVMDIIIDGREFTQPAGQSCHVPQGVKHRMANSTNAPAAVIEVQTGDYLDEDDITRYEDIYGRC